MCVNVSCKTNIGALKLRVKRTVSLSIVLTETSKSLSLHDKLIGITCIAQFISYIRYISKTQPGSVFMGFHIL